MFDPYHKWLGIPKGQRPPTHYQLLGIAPDEKDIEVIEEAAIRQTTHVRAYQIGPQAAECTRLLNEIAKARQTLTNPAKRKEYDAQLPKQAVAAGSPAPPQAQAKARESDNDVWQNLVTESQPGPRKAPAKGDPMGGRRPRGEPEVNDIRKRSHVGLIVGGVVAAIVLIGVIIIAVAPALFERKDEQLVHGDIDKGKERPVDPDPDPKVDPKKEEPKEKEKPDPAPGGNGDEPIVVADFREHKLSDPVMALARTADPKQLVLGGADLKLWDMDKGVVHVFVPKSRGITESHLAAMPDGKSFFAAQGGEAAITRWGVEKRTALGGMPRLDAAVHSLTVSHSGKLLVSGGTNGMLQVWSAATFKQLAEFKGRGWAWGVAISPDSDKLFFASGGTCYYWDLPEGTKSKGEPVAALKGDVVWAAFAPDGIHVIGCDNDKLYVFNCMTREKESTRIGFFNQGMVLTPSGTYALTYGQSRQIKLWDWKTRKVVKVFDGGPLERVFAVACSADGKWLYSSNHMSASEYSLRVWPLNDDAVALVTPSDPKTKEPPPDLTKVPKRPVPAEEAVKLAEKNIRDQFKKEYAKKAPADMVALAEKLLQLGVETKDDVASRYVLLCEARDLAARGGKSLLALKAIDELTGDYAIDALEMRQSVAVAVGKLALGKESSRELTEAALSVAADFVQIDRFEPAEKLLAIAESAARKTQTPSLVAQVQKQDKQVKELAGEYERMKKAGEVLANDAKNPEANLDVGKYLAFRKGQWDKGLPLLALAGAGAWPELARRDLAMPEDAKGQLDLAEAWWEAGQKEAPLLKSSLEWRACHWYRQALPRLTGLNLAKATDRIKKVEEQPSPFQIVDNLGEIRRFKGHKGAVTSLALAPDGKRLFSGGMDGTVRSWELAGAKSQIFLLPQVAVTDFALSPDERHLAASSATGFRIWDVKSGQPLRFLKNERSALPGVTWLDANSVIYIDEVRFSSLRLSGGGGSGPIQASPRLLVVSANLERAMIVGASGANSMFRLVGVGGRQAAGAIENYKALCGALSADGALVALGGQDHSIAVHEFGKGNDPKKILQGHSGPIRSVAFSPNGQRLLSGGDDKSVRLWDVSTGRELHRFALHTDAVLAVLFSADGRYAFSASADGTIRMWNLPK